VGAVIEGVIRALRADGNHRRCVGDICRPINGAADLGSPGGRPTTATIGGRHDVVGTTIRVTDVAAERDAVHRIPKGHRGYTGHTHRVKDGRFGYRPTGSAVCRPKDSSRESGARPDPGVAR
jgi:hypothetical protein